MLLVCTLTERRDLRSVNLEFADQPKPRWADPGSSGREVGGASSLSPDRDRLRPARERVARPRETNNLAQQSGFGHHVGSSLFSVQLNRVRARGKRTGSTGRKT